MSRTARILGSALVPLVTLPTFGAHATAAQAAPTLDEVPAPPTKWLPSALDSAAVYVGQTTCSPDPKPGTAQFAKLMAEHYDEWNYGIARACGSGQTEHSEGRALDWMLNVNDAREKAIADSVVAWLVAPDSEGRKGAMARRFGIMYIIWNRKMWRAYDPDRGWADYSGVSPHTDHIHFSFSWDGAYAKTSWWTGKALITDGTTEAPAPTSYPTLKYGATGADVKLAQEVLGVTADGVFGPATLSALKAWQTKQGIPVTGVLDSATWTRMVKLGLIEPRGTMDAGLAKYLDVKLRLGSTGEAVVALQRALGITADGKFGPATETAVKKLQTANGNWASGIVTRNVWLLLIAKEIGTGSTETPTTPTPVETVVTTTEFTPYKDVTLRKGSRGTAVKVLQKALGGITVDGAFGAKTESTLIAFQKAQGLWANGIANKNDWNALEDKWHPYLDYRSVVLKEGSTGAAVTALQRGLRIPADGKFGPMTKQAVMSLQGRHSLTRTGVVGSRTWIALEAEVAARS
ncbi:peptidoglycan-binding domain-containing protein [Janibacter sp. G1551]|uniref:peptidoglycan-binding domain-containing protein n=1 Tax=Janibacter sp. G1551 TaxID=3420440 RepID=UPI003D04FE92